MTVSILTGDVREVLATLPSESMHCCVTSPPYWGLRSYLPEGHPSKALEIGLEPSIEDWVRTMVEVFRDVRRVLRPDGTLWLNLGDSYAGARDPKATHTKFITGTKAGVSAEAAGVLAARRRASTDSRRRDRVEIPRSDMRMPGFKPKDLIGQPWRAALALHGFAVISCKTLGEWAGMLAQARAAQDWEMVALVEQRIRHWDYAEALKADGWQLRQELIWAKRNPMPESAKDRFTRAHEHIFLFAKTRHYYFDYAAIQEPVNGGAHPRKASTTGVGFGHGTDKEARGRDRVRQPSGWATEANGRAHTELAGRYPQPEKTDPAARLTSANADGKSKRMGREPGWRAKVADRASLVKSNHSYEAAMVEMRSTRNPRSVRVLTSEPFRGSHFATYPQELIRPFILAGCPVGGTVLDPFGGSGTTGLVADQLHRNAVLIDLDERSEAMAADRMRGQRTLFPKVIP